MDEKRIGTGLYELVEKKSRDLKSSGVSPAEDALFDAATVR